MEYVHCVFLLGPSTKDTVDLMSQTSPVEVIFLFDSVSKLSKTVTRTFRMTTSTRLNKKILLGV